MKKDYILKKWLVDKLTDSESKDFESFDDFDLNTKIIEKAKLFDIPENLSVKSYNDFKRDIPISQNKVVQLKPYHIFYRIAGIFIIAIGLYFLFFFNTLTTIETLASQKTTFELPDASEVILNADSKAAFNKKQWDKNRKLTLDGEAFFKVEKGSKFDVVTSNGIVSVLGTQFNVKNRDSYFEVKCFEGIVSVQSNGTTKKLTKGNTFRIFNNTILLDSVMANQPQWIQNISSFKAVPLAMVIEELERQYDVDIETININTERMFTGSFANDDIEQALLSITVPFNLTYRKSSTNKISIYKGEQ